MGIPVVAVQAERARERPLPDDRIGKLAERLRRRYAERISGELTLPASDGCFSSPPEDMHPGLRRALESAIPGTWHRGLLASR